MAAEQDALATRWLTRLHEIVSLELNEVFPSAQLLDHIPRLIGEIAAYLRAPADAEIAANAAVIAKAHELGLLRHEQHASVHQLLREYEILWEILEGFIVDETRRLDLRPDADDYFDLVRRLTRSTQTLLRTTVDTFVGEYTTMIQERNSRIENFHRMASHEMRSPVGTLLFAAAVLGNDGVRNDAHRVAKIAATVRSNAERLSWLIDNLQRLARLDAPIDLPSLQRVDLGITAREVARQIEDVAAASGVAIRIAPELPVLMADPARLELVLLNLLSNAIKYRDPAKPMCLVEIATGPHDGDGNCVITVRDNGIGIADADQSAIFDRFFRAHAHLDGERGVTGTGLGLAIVSDCVKALGGSIECKSAVGIGTTFFVTLPRGETPNL